MSCKNSQAVIRSTYSTGWVPAGLLGPSMPTNRYSLAVAISIAMQRDMDRTAPQALFLALI